VLPQLSHYPGNGFIYSLGSIKAVQSMTMHTLHVCTKHGAIGIVAARYWNDSKYMHAGHRYVKQVATHCEAYPHAPRRKDMYSTLIYASVELN